MEIIIKETADLASKDLTQIYFERIKVFVVEQACAYQEVDEDDADATHVMIKDQADLLAYARILDRGDHVVVGRVLVTLANRSQGLSYKLMEAALSHIGSNQEVRLSAQTYIVGLYQSFGFEVVSEEYLEDGIPHVDMVRMPQ